MCVSTQGKYALVEFRDPAMATAALALSGQVQVLGCTLSVARPSGYVDPSKALNASAAANAALAAFKRGDMQVSTGGNAHARHPIPT
jgi:hypothetical protein